MAWVIPIVLAYVPGLVIGFMVFTLLASPYRELELVAAGGPLACGRLAGRHDPDRRVATRPTAIVPTLEGIAALSYAGPVEVVLADNGSTDSTAELAEEHRESARTRLPARA